MALAANALTTFDAVRALLGLGDGDQTECERIINVASAAIEKYCGRGLAKAERVERYAPPRGERLILDCSPVDAEATLTVKVDGAEVTAEVEDAALGFLRIPGGWSGTAYEQLAPGSVTLATIPGTARRVVEVTYAAGFDPVPPDLEQAAIETVCSLWRRRGTDGRASAYDTANEAIGRGIYGIIPGSVLPIVNSYRRAMP